MSKITVIGIGPGNPSDMTMGAIEALRKADVVVGYKFYIPFISGFLKPEAEVISNGMKQERVRVAKAFEIAIGGRDVCVVSSGDSGIYGMAPLVLEMRRELNCPRVEVEIIPGVSAFQKAASLLGAPTGHDFCVISLSDLMTPWQVIEKRIVAAAQADFVTAIYNPKSTGRYWQLGRLRELFMQFRSPFTPVGYVRQAGREEERVTVTTLGAMNVDDIDMFTVVIIGNSRCYESDGLMITPRGYYNEGLPESKSQSRPGQSIMIESFRTIQGELHNPDIPLYKKWPMLHAIHTTADFNMEDVLIVDENAPERIYSKLESGEVNTIITDVTMAASGIRKGALSRLGVEVKCYLNEPGVAEYAASHGITRSQAAIRKAVEEHPDALFAIGNAPTALMELCSLIRQGKASPCGIVAAPVGFVHVCESKHMVKPFKDIPKIIVEGRKGGSNLAATLVNSILCWPDAAQLKPGRDV